MCHFTLHVHPCGDSYFTKYSSCSYDRAAHHPNSILNPLHPLMTPEIFRTSPSSWQHQHHHTLPPPPFPCPPSIDRIPPAALPACDFRISVLSNLDAKVLSPTTKVNAGLISPPDSLDSLPREEAPAAKGVPMPPLSAIGIHSTQSVQAGEAGKCYVFEVVLTRQEMYDCPSCRRSIRRRRLPARSRGIFAVS
ncbi:MAG: hypothetical protein M1829_003886 [Trizodia sp. TS-e1964]|nr:MAG: hypothetical protein M1829_003886 [Trizodia sp. TS-e1964]